MTSPSAGGADAAMNELASVLGGTGRLHLVHANDSKDACGSHRDRHENIGAGQIGARPFGTCCDTRPQRASRS